MARWRHLRFEFSAMASSCVIMLDGRDEKVMRQAAGEAIAEVRRIENKYSRYRSDSILSEINRQAGKAWTRVDAETAQLLDFAHSLWQQSDGLFDITSGILRRAWDFKSGQLPAQVEIDALLPLIGLHRLQRHGGDSVRLALVGMEIDFGGFGKEYAVDRATAVLRAHGIGHALVNLGGDLFALGTRGLPECEGVGWKIKIQEPRPVPHGAVPAARNTLPQFELANQAMATSGDYERYFIHEGQRYCHILNPVTGWPVKHFQSVTVVAPNTVSAGAISTISMLKQEDGLHWIENQKLPYVVKLADGTMRMPGSGSG